MKAVVCRPRYPNIHPTKENKQNDEAERNVASNGDLINIEIKLFVNCELSDGRVIAQIVDYAPSFSALREKQLASLFGRDCQNHSTLPAQRGLSSIRIVWADGSNKALGSFNF